MIQIGWRNIKKVIVIAMLELYDVQFVLQGMTYDVGVTFSVGDPTWAFINLHWARQELVTLNIIFGVAFPILSYDIHPIIWIMQIELGEHAWKSSHSHFVNK
jgi:hypothetical protein